MAGPAEIAGEQGPGQAGTDNGERGLFLARDSTAIGLGEVMERVRGGGPAVAANDLRVSAMIDRLREVEREAFGEFTVKDLVEHSAATGLSTKNSPKARATSVTFQK